MGVGGIVLMTVCLANALTIQAHYCPCNYNSEPFAPEKYYESLLPYENSFSSFPNQYQSHKQEPFHQSYISSSFPQQFHKNTVVEWPKRSEVPKTSNQVKQQENIVKENPSYEVMSQIMSIGKEEPKINNKIENATVPLERLEEKDARMQYAVQEKVTEGPQASEQKIIQYNSQHLQSGLLMPYVQQFHKPTPVGPERLEMFKPSNEAREPREPREPREQKIIEKEKPASEVPQQMANKKKEQSKKNPEIGSQNNNGVSSRRTQENKGRITHGNEGKRMEGSSHGSSGHEHEIYESRSYEISNSGDKPISQVIIQRSPHQHFSYFPPNFMGVEIL